MDKDGWDASMRVHSAFILGNVDNLLVLELPIFYHNLLLPPVFFVFAPCLKNELNGVKH